VLGVGEELQPKGVVLHEIAKFIKCGRGLL
jgi:hypothetical protein